MKNKLISTLIILVFLFTSLINVNAVAQVPKIELDEYNITTSDSNNVYFTGTCSISKGQLIGVYDNTGIILYKYEKLQNNNSISSFKIQIPARYIKEGINTFKIKSLPANGVINGSNSKTVTVELKNITKKNQIISASNLSLKVNEKQNLNAKVDSGLSLTYKSNNPNVATVDAYGNVVGRNVGTTQIVISQSGNGQYNSTTKTVTITVKDNSVNIKKEYTITYDANGGKGSMLKQTVVEGQTIKLTKNKFTRSGYKFKGWNITTNNKVKYKDGESIKLDKNIILYAIWEKNKSKADKIIETCDKLCYVNNGKVGAKGPWSAKVKGTKPKKEAREAFKRNGFKQKNQCADCGYFVSTVIHEVTGKKVKILGKNGRTSFPGGNNSIKKAGFKKISTKKNIPLSSLKPGDVLRYHKTTGSQHTLIYYGNGKVAEAGRSSAIKLIRWPVIQKGNKKWQKRKIKDFQVWRIQE